MTTATSGLLRTLAARWRRLAATLGDRHVTRESFRTRPMIGLHSTNPHPAEAVRWLGPVNIAGRVHDALFCHPDSRIEYRVAAQPGDRVAGFVSLLADVWQKNTGGVGFSVRVTIAEGRAAEYTTRVDPGRRSGDRRWRRFALAIPVTRRQDVTVAFSTNVPPGARPDHAWAVWGSPGIERPRRVSEIWADLRTRLARRPLGLRALSAARVGGDPTARYRAWIEQHPLTPEALQKMRAEADRLPYRPVISVITPVFNTDPRWLRACIESVRQQAYPHWELCLCDDASTSTETRAVLDELEAQSDPRIRVTRLERNSHISAASNAALAIATGDFIALLDHDDELTPDALFEAAAHVNRAPETAVLYSDEDKRDPDGNRSDPFFKPDWSPEHLLSAMYTSHLTVARRTTVEEVGGFRVGYEGSQDHDLALRLSDVVPAFHHVPKVLYHWRRAAGSTASTGAEKPWAQDAGVRALRDWLDRRNIEGAVESGGVPGLYRVRFAIRGDPLVSIIIVSADRDAGAAQACAAHVRDSTAYAHVEILGADEPVAANAAEVNAAVRRSAGSHVVCLDAGLDSADGEWLTSLLEYSQQEAVGVVGAKILYADGRLRHIGLWLGVGAGVARPMHQHPGASYGYFSSAIGVRNYSAVSGECLMTRRAVFDEIGGFDERLPWSVADVDYCLRASRAGRRAVFTPYARLAQRQAASLGGATPPAAAIAALRQVWGNRIDRDPYHNVNLSRTSDDAQLPADDFSVDVVLDQPVPDVLQDPLNLRIDGWFDAGERQREVISIDAYDGDDLLGRTELFFPRPDATTHDGTPHPDAEGFSMLLNAPQLIGRPSAPLTIRVRLRDETSIVGAACTVTLVTHDYRRNHYGELVSAETTYILHRGNIYGSGPCPYSVGETSPECLALVRRHLGPPPKRVLDVGCGSGAYGAPLRADGYDWLGVEVKAADCEELTRRGLPHQQVDGRTLPFPTASFERAICIEVLEHIEDPGPFLAEIRRVVSGRLIVSVPNAELIPYLQDLGVVPWHCLEGDHKNFFGRANFRALLLQHFRHVEILTYGRLPVDAPEGLPLDVHLYAVCDV